VKKHTPPVPEPLSPGLRRFLYLTATVTGAAIMIVEILGAKMLAPFVGTSHFVWTAQIAVTLVALAAGYYAGGKLVDRSPELGRLYAALLAAGVYLGITTLVVRPVAYWCLEFKLAVGSLLASAFLFFVPLSLLAMAGPFLVRMLTSSLIGVGGNVGRLTALSTLGSFAGTVLIGYVLIPLLPNSLTMMLTACALFGVVVIYFFGWGRKSPAQAGVILALVLGLTLGYAGVARELRGTFRDFIELHRANSNFGLLQVLDSQSSDYRLYLNDYLVQNTYAPVEKQSLSMFTYMLHDLAQAYTPRLRRALCIGLGVGIVPMQFVRDGVAVDVVEINPGVVPVAREYFNCDPAQLNLVIGDGRQFINRTTNRYDTIVLDAFLGDSSPSHLMTREAFDAMRQRLEPDGTLVINCFADFRPRHDYFGASLDKTLKSVFRSVKIHALSGGNVFFVASDRRELAMVRPPDFNAVHRAVRSQVEAAFRSLAAADPQQGRVLTDDYNPVEFYDAANREVIRRRLARDVRAF
jgi:spermidine synthase